MKKISLLILLFLYAFIAYNQDYNSSDFIKKGVALYDEGKYPEAIQMYKQVFASDTNYVHMMSELAMTYLASKSYDESIETCKQALVDITVYENHIMRTLATAYDERGDSQEAINIYSKALVKYPYDYLLLYNLGITYYRANNYPKALEYCQKALKSNPFHTSSHLMLGKISAAQGQICHAFLSFQTFLVLEPNSKRSNKALVCLENLANNYIDTSYVGERIDPFVSNTLFKELDHYLRAKIVLTNRFETAYEFNASMVKQTQLILEKLPYETKEKDFWAEFYFPFYQNTKKKNFVKEFLNTTIRSARRESINKWAKKNEKTLKEFYATGTYLGQYKSYRWLSDSVRISCQHYDSGALEAIGNSNKEGNENGNWTYYFENGCIQASGRFINGKKDGAWIYYNFAGYKETICSYANGELKGEYCDFDSYGNKKSSISYQMGELNGDVKFFYPCDIIKEYNHYTKGKLNGPGFVLYPTRDTLSTFSFKDSKMDGVYKSYHANGKLFYQTYYKNGFRDGDYIEYHSDGSRSVKGKYVQEKEDGDWVYFYKNGKTKSKASYKDGKKVGKWIGFNEDGSVMHQFEYNTNGQLIGDYVIYKNGKIHLIETFRKDTIIASISFNNKGDTIKHSGSVDGTFAYETYSLDGLLMTKGQFYEGQKTGNSYSYRRNGNVQESSTYKNGLLEGELIGYFENGIVNYQKTFTKGKENGIYQENYNNGKLKTKGKYVNGEMDGLWLNYYVDGTLEQEFSYKKGDATGWMSNYAVDGKLALKTKYIKGEPIEICQYNSTGEMIHSQVLLTAGKREFMNCNNTIEGECAMTCGKMNGDLVWYHPNGNKFIEKHFENDNASGAYIRYYPSGEIRTKGQSSDGTQTGLWTDYYEDGTIQRTYNYVMDQLDSTYTVYWENGNVKSKSKYKNDEKDGDHFYYDPEGNLLIKKIYVDGEIFAYQYNKNGALCDTIYLENGNGKIIAYYDNGKPSVKSAYKNGRLDGKCNRYFRNGKMICSMEFSMGTQFGEEILSDVNGKLKKKINYAQNLKEGECRSYYPNGKLKRLETYKMGCLHGECKTYNEMGKLTSIEKYWNNKLSNYKVL